MFFFPLPLFVKAANFLCSIAPRSAVLLCTNRLLDVSLVCLVFGTLSVLLFLFYFVYCAYVQITDRSLLRLYFLKERAEH